MAEPGRALFRRPDLATVTATGTTVQLEAVHEFAQGYCAFRQRLACRRRVLHHGRVFLRDPVDVGQIELYRFQNSAGLSSVGENLYKQTPASGKSIAGRPGFEGFGKSIHKFLEMSNVSTVSEMVNMIVAQRAYEFNSKAIQTSDSMLGTAASLKR